MGRKWIRIDYTAYSPNYVPDEGICLDFKTLRAAQQYTRRMGDGAIILRNFNQDSKDGSLDWWQSERCWRWTGTCWKRVMDERPVTH